MPSLTTEQKSCSNFVKYPSDCGRDWKKRQKEKILKYSDLTNAYIAISIDWKTFYYSHKTRLIKEGTLIFTVNDIGLGGRVVSSFFFSAMDVQKNR